MSQNTNSYQFDTTMIPAISLNKKPTYQAIISSPSTSYLAILYEESQIKTWLYLGEKSNSEIGPNYDEPPSIGVGEMAWLFSC